MTLFKRWLPHPLLAIALTVFWLLLNSRFSLGDLVLGALLGLIIPILTSNFWPQRPNVRSYRHVVIYVLMVAWDIVMANILVAKLILFRPVSQLKTRWVSLPLELKSPEAITLLAGTITLTPGTVSSDISADGQSLLIHCLDAEDAEVAVRHMKNRYEARLKEIFT